MITIIIYIYIIIYNIYIAHIQYCVIKFTKCSITNLDYFITLLDISTTSPDDSDQCYIGQMMFERIGNREWLAKFMVFKDDSKREKVT